MFSVTEKWHIVWNVTFGELEAAVLTISPTKFSNPKEMGNPTGSAGETAVMLCQHSSAAAKVLLCYQHLSRY